MYIHLTQLRLHLVGKEGKCILGADLNENMEKNHSTFTVENDSISN